MNMKMNVKIRLGKFAAVALLIGGVNSCEDFMEYQPYGAGDSSTFWKTEADVKSALNAFYNYANSEETTARGTYWYENCSDNMITGRVHVAADRIRNFQMAPTDLDQHTNWNNMFAVISKANAILKDIDNVPGLSKAVRDNAVGQAYFFRAYGYQWECPWYADVNNGGLPIMTETTPITELDQPRPQSVIENYDMIIDDFKKAAELLPSYSQISGEDRCRPYKTAAWAFAARAALYAAQYGPNGDSPQKDGSKYHKGQSDEKEWFDVVIEMCDNIINLTGADKRELHYLAANHDFNDPKTNSYGLPASNFSDLFRIENNFSKEYIFSILGTGAARSGPKFHGMSFYNAGFGGYNTWGYYAPTAELYEAFGDHGQYPDTRRDATIMSPGQSIIHPTATGSIENRIIRLAVPGDLGDVKSDFFTSLLNRKMHSVFEQEGGYARDYWTSGDYQSNSLGQILIRYADILLMKAEALIWLNRDLPTALGYINEVRARAGVPPSTASSPADLKELLKNERRCEFAFEFFPSRHLDLVRWGDAQATYARPVHGYVVNFTTVDGNPYTFVPSEKKQVWGPRTFDPVKNNVFPIHQNIINKSDGVLKQNKGY
ncbi:membrane protein [Bacteroidia bacterium]|nr:membrane protein [Bacteroidia bacterium]